MSVARVTEISAESPLGFDAAIREGIERAAQTLHNIKNVWIKEQEVVLKDNKPAQYRVDMKLTFVLDE